MSEEKGTNLGNAYVQIIPTTKGIKGTLQNALNGEADAAGSIAGGTIASKIKGIIAATGIGETLRQGLLEGAALEQSLGGIETLFKDSSNIVIQNAKNAFQTAGMSANAYMETVTSFSASLLQSLGGDTQMAAEIADMALTDMSDNANKFGTDMESIKFAYQGFAKQNYTMLDNLKLGYGGTKEEMERLLADAEKLSGVQYDISSLSDIYNAIHVIQENLGIAGATAAEAATTFSGSFSAMKAAAKNALGNMALGEKIDFDALAKTASTFVFDNLIPMLGNIVTALPEIAAGFVTYVPVFLEKGQELLSSMVTGIVKSIPQKLPEALAFVQQLGDDIAEKAPEFIEKGFQLLSELVDGIISAIPILIQNVPKIVSTFANVINDNFPKILAKGVELLWQFLTGILGTIPTLVENIPQIITAIIDTVMAFNWLNLGSQIMTFFKNGITNMIPQIKTAGQNIFNGIRDTVKNLPSTLMNLGKSAMYNFGNTISGLKSYITTNVWKIVNGIETTLQTLPSKVFTIGQNIITGIWDGIAEGWTWLLDSVQELANSIFEAACDALDINSPSKKFEWIAEMTGEGYVKGNQKQTPRLVQAVKTQQDSVVKAAEESSVRHPVSDIHTPEERIIKIVIPVKLNGREIARGTAEFTSEQLMWEMC